jgi:hypothetical protein
MSPAKRCWTMRTRLQSVEQASDDGKWHQSHAGWSEKAKQYISQAGAAHGSDEQQQDEAQESDWTYPMDRSTAKGGQEGGQWYQIGAKVVLEAATACGCRREEEQRSVVDQSRRVRAGRSEGGCKTCDGRDDGRERRSGGN